MSAFDFLPTLPSLPYAKCRDTDNPDLFFPFGHKQEQKFLIEVKVICGGCMNRAECLKFAIDEQIPHGLWAGTTPDERIPLWSSENIPTGMPKVAYRIRALYNAGHSPKEIALLIGSHRTYVNKVLDRERKAKAKGEIQSNLRAEDLSDKPF